MLHTRASYPRVVSMPWSTHLSPLKEPTTSNIVNTNKVPVTITNGSTPYDTLELVRGHRMLGPSPGLVTLFTEKSFEQQNKPSLFLKLRPIIFDSFSDALVY